MNRNGNNNTDNWIDEIMNEVNARENRYNDERYDAPSNEFGYIVNRSDNIANDMAIRF